MSDDLPTLETQRSKLLEEFLGLGDLRPGSITAVTRRCGKPSCHCAKHNDPGHDPQFRLTRRASGKTVTETFPNPTALRKAQQEVVEFHRFQELSQNLLGGERFARQTRPLPDPSGRPSGVAQTPDRAAGLLPALPADGSQQPFFFLLRPPTAFLRDRAESTNPFVEGDQVPPP